MATLALIPSIQYNGDLTGMLEKKIPARQVTTTAGIVNNTIKRQRSRTTETRYFGYYAKRPRNCLTLANTQWQKIWATIQAKRILHQ